MGEDTGHSRRLVRVRSHTVVVVTLITSVFTLVSALPLEAQEIQPGLRIRSRVTPPGEWHTGTLVRFGPDSLVLQRCRDCAAEAQPWARVTRVEVSEGMTWSGRHIAIGAFAGGVIAAWLDKRKVDRDLARCNDGPCGLAALEIPVVGVLGAVGGAVLGALWRAESWREIYAAEPARD